MVRKYLDASVLQLGDVLLSQSKDKVHRAIAVATGGRFSHAAIYVSNYQLFEATRTGVGFGALVPSRIEVKSNRRRVLCSTEDLKEIAVFRCPQSLRRPPSDNPNRLLTAIYPLLWTLNGLEYKKLADFKNIKSRLNWIPETVRGYILKHLGNVFLKDHRKVLEQEFFCSELVVYVLSKQGMQVLKQQDTGPSTLSPNDLGNTSISNLQEVPAAICQADHSAQTQGGSSLLVEQMFATPISDKNVVKMTKELQSLSERILREATEAIGRQRGRSN